MRNRVRTITILASVMLVHSTVIADSRLGADPATFNRQFDAALTRGDIDFMNAILTDDWKFTVNNAAAVWSKPQWLEFVRNTKYAARDTAEDIVERHGNVVIST